MNSKAVHKDLVLVVDDSPDTLGMLNDALEAHGMTTLVALEGEQAVNIAHKMLPDIILLDALMPNMDGFEVCRELKSDPELRGIPVVFMTGLSDTENIIKAFKSGGVDYVTKPIVNEELIARMRVHLANARITLSAQTALDRAGQNVFAVDQHGVIRWATPSVNISLDRSDNKCNSLRNRLPEFLSTWLRHTPSIGNKIQIPSSDRNLDLVYLGQPGEDEYLIRIIDSSEEYDLTCLKNSLPVTNREAEVLMWIARGKTNREIGQIIATSPRTVNKHLEQIYKKLGVENRTSAAARAISILTR